MSSTTSTSKPADAAKKPEEPAADASAQPTLGVLEEDDEFEEFVAQGTHPSSAVHANIDSRSVHLDWDDSQTDLAHLGGAAPGAAQSAGNKLWEDNWDDDDIEDEFSVQLRCVCRISGSS